MLISRALPHALALGLLLDVGAASAQQIQRVANAATVHPPGEYNGVTPQNSARPPRARSVARAEARATRRRGRRRAPAQVVTWPGFQAQPDGSSTFFLQVTGPVEYERHVTTGRVEILLPNTRTHVRNSRRPLITRYYDTPVTLAKLERRGRRDLAFVFTMRADVAPTVRTEERGGFTFIYVSFPAGNYLPRDAVRVAPADPSERVAPAPAASDSPYGAEDPYGDPGTGGGSSAPAEIPVDEGSGLSLEQLQDMDDEAPPPVEN